MPRFRAARAALVAVVLMPGVAAPPAAQDWNDARVTALVTRATERRARQLADTGLTDYTATAVGSLTFLAQVGEGFPDPPKVVKADQIALEVYWRAPNHSKQLILGRRDTLLLPTDIQYHRDHLGIVQNNFPEIIRLGDGDEVRDVPHPLSATGLRAYDYSISDSLRIEVPGQVIEVYEVRVRPKDDHAPAAVGAVYLARADAQVVRMAFSFTRAALLDPQLDDVSIVLDNALIEERFWLPRRQEIEIRRSGTWLDFPARGIIRGGFEVCCYRINAGTPGIRFTGPEIELAPPARRATYQFPEPLSAVVPPDLATASGEELSRVQARAVELVGQAALARARRGALLAGSVSDLVRVNRAEGLSLGAGVRRRVGSAVDIALTGRYGVADREPKGVARLTWRPMAAASIRFGAFDEVRDATDVPEVSGVRNSIGAQEFGADFTEPYRVRGFDLRLERRPTNSAITVSLGVAREWTEAVTVEAVPARGTYRPVPDIPSRQGWRADMALSVAPRPLSGGIVHGSLAVQVRRLRDADDVSMPARGTARLELKHPIALGTMVASTFAGIASGGLPQDLVRAGGPVTAPGYRAHQFVSRALISQRLEWQFPVPFPSIPVGRWGRSPAGATLAPLTAIVVQEDRDPSGERRAAGYLSVGAGLLVFFDLVRFDVARGLRNGRWTFGVDVSRDLWRIL
ncbi:MAG TPA: hypothetical protein VIK50_14690 [Gemmatimonadaceae bacterium]